MFPFAKSLIPLTVMKLENRICACGCLKSFRCLPTSATRYSSLHCMELAGALPPVEKFGRSSKGNRTEAKAKGEPDLDQGSEDSEAPLLLDDEDEALQSKNPPEVELATL
jgi:hypothetical protein